MTGSRKALIYGNAQYSYVILSNFEMEVTNIVKTKPYELTDEEKVPIIKNWLGKEGLQLLKTFTNEEKETVEEQIDSFWYLLTNSNHTTVK